MLGLQTRNRENAARKVQNQDDAFLLHYVYCFDTYFQRKCCVIDFAKIRQDSDCVTVLRGMHTTAPAAPPTALCVAKVQFTAMWCSCFNLYRTETVLKMNSC